MQTPANHSRGDIGTCCIAGELRVLGIAVVLADDDHGQGPDGLACHGVHYDGIRLHRKEGCSTACQHAGPLDGGANPNYADTDHQ